MPTYPYIHPLTKMLPASGCQGAAGQEWDGVSLVLTAASGSVCAGHLWHPLKVGVGRMCPIHFTSFPSVGFFQGKQSQIWSWKYPC